MKILLLLLLALPAFSMERAQSWCERGAAVTVSPSSVGGAPSARNFQQSFPHCTVTVFITGSGGMKATLFSDNISTPLDNPFTADQFGLWAFYAANGHYDVQISGGTPPPALSVPYTFGDILLQDGYSLYTGIFDDSDPDTNHYIGLNATVGLQNNSFNQTFANITNFPGSYRPVAVNGWMIVPPNTTENATTYEADAIAGITLSGSENVNNVAGSFFTAPTQDSPNGLANITGGTLLTRVTGPPFKPSWCPNPGGMPYVNTLMYIELLNNFCEVFVDSDHIVLSIPTTNANNIVWAKRLIFWALNTANSDALSGITPTHGFKYTASSAGELDFNINSTTTDLIALSIGGNGTTHGHQVFGYLCNGLGTDLNGDPIKWDTCFSSLPQVANNFASIGPQSYTGPSPSQTIVFFNYTSGQVPLAGILGTDGQGNFLFSVGQGATHGENPQYVFLDAENHQLIGLQGRAGGAAHGILEGAGNMQFQPGADTLANIIMYGGGGSAMVRCTDCSNVANDHIVAGSFCVGGSTAGALAIKVVGGNGWACI